MKNPAELSWWIREEINLDVILEKYVSERESRADKIDCMLWRSSKQVVEECDEGCRGEMERHLRKRCTK